MKRYKYCLGMVLTGFIFFIASSAYAGLTMTLDTNHLDFGTMSIGGWKELAIEGSYHNEVRCSSTNAKTWYLKIYMLMPFTAGENTISESCLKWKVTEVTSGTGIIFNEDKFNDFSLIPQVAYTSGPNDNSGNQVKVQVSYGMLLPQNQIVGNYSAMVRFVMMETL